MNGIRNCEEELASVCERVCWISASDGNSFMFPRAANDGGEDSSRRATRTISSAVTCSRQN